MKRKMRQAKGTPPGLFAWFLRVSSPTQAMSAGSQGDTHVGTCVLRANGCENDMYTFLQIGTNLGFSNGMAPRGVLSLLLSLCAALFLMDCATPDPSVPGDPERSDLNLVQSWVTSTGPNGEQVFTGLAADGRTMEAYISVATLPETIRIEVANRGYGVGTLVFDVETGAILEDTRPNPQLSTQAMFELVMHLAGDSSEGGGYAPTHNRCIDDRALLDWVPRTCGELQEFRDNQAGAALGIAVVAMLILPTPWPWVGALLAAGGLGTSGAWALSTYAKHAWTNCMTRPSSEPIYWCE